MKRNLRLIFAVVIMILLIWDTDTAAQGAVKGIALCTDVIIPSLFPFFVVSAYLHALLIGHSASVLRPLVRMLNIPDGGDSFLLFGLIGGYPVGAQLVAQAGKNNQISCRTAKILLGYCSNAGPAFIFGVAGSLFSSKFLPVMLWIIHMTAVLLTGFLLPKPEPERIDWNCMENPSIVYALRKSISICTITCGWIIVFKIILAYLDAWLPLTPSSNVLILISGILELSNGCTQLSKIHSESMRFILCSAFLSFGGICVLLQTASVTDGIGLGFYLSGKLMQAAFSTMMAILSSYILFPHDPLPLISSVIWLLLCMLILLLVRMRCKKDMEIPQKIMYNHIS